MIITYHGDNYLRLQSGNTTVLVDPTTQRSFRGANIILNTLLPGTTPRPGDEEEGVPFWVEHQGEYEVQGIHIRGWSTGNDGTHEYTAFRVLFEDISFAFLGHLQKDPGADLIAELKGADVLVIPGGGKPYLAPDAAARAVRQIEPGAVIPTLGKDMKQFLKELGQATVTPEEKFVFKKKDLTPGKMAVHLLKT